MSADLRTQILILRRALSVEETRRLSDEVIARFVDGCGLGPVSWKGKVVALYRAMPGEPGLTTLEKMLESWGARLCFPRVIDPRLSTMEFASLPVRAILGSSSNLSKSMDWPMGAFGIAEPPPHFEVVPPESLDFIFVPGVAFGVQGERIGMGGGYYDRYLPLATRALRIALAFDFQLQPKLEQEPWDQRMDWIWTEGREVRIRTSSPS